MTEEQNNALRATARRCNDELKAAMAQKPKPKFDAVSRPLLATGPDQHRFNRPLPARFRVSRLSRGETYSCRT